MLSQRNPLFFFLNNGALNFDIGDTLIYCYFNCGYVSLTLSQRNPLFFLKNNAVLVMAYVGKQRLKKQTYSASQYCLRGKTAKETEEKLNKYYCTSALSNTTVKRWMQELRLGRTSQMTNHVQKGL